MLKLKYLLLTSVVIVVSNNVLASEIKLTFDDTGSPLVNTYTTHTPMELKPISLFNSDNAIKLAAVCAIGGGGCSGLEFGKSNNSMLLDKAAQCKDEGYAASCPSGYVLDYTKPCIYNKSYYKCRVCSHTCPSGSLNNCSSTQVLTATTSNDCLETCYQCRDKTCVEGGYTASLTSCQNGTAFSFANKTCYKDVSDKTCEDGGYKSDIPTNNVCTAVAYCNKICQSNCYQPTCEDGGYKSAVPANNVCTDVTYYGRTCKKDCYQPTCDYNNSGYKSGVPNNQVCTPVSYYGRTCYQNCYQPQCTAGGYVSACPTNQIGTSVTYYGRNCYKNCKESVAVGSILYSDMTTSKTIISGKTPIGVVFDTDKKLAVALEEEISKFWSDYEGSKVDITSLENCTRSVLSCDTNGKANTAAIIAFGKANYISHPAAEYCNKYTTPGTKAGDWFLPSLAELNSIYNAKSTINATLNLLGKSSFTDDIYYNNYWTSNENLGNIALALCMGNGKDVGGSKYGTYNIVRPVLAF